MNAVVESVQRAKKTGKRQLKNPVDKLLVQHVGLHFKLIIHLVDMYTETLVVS